MIRSAVMDDKGELLEEVHVGNAELDEIAQQYEGATFLRQCSQKQYRYHGRDVLPETPDSRGSHGSLPKISLRLTSGRQSRPFDNAQPGSEQFAVGEGDATVRPGVGFGERVGVAGGREIVSERQEESVLLVTQGSF